MEIVRASCNIMPTGFVMSGAAFILLKNMLPNVFFFVLKHCAALHNCHRTMRGHAMEAHAIEVKLANTPGPNEALSCQDLFVNALLCCAMQDINTLGIPVNLHATVREHV